MNSNVLIGKPSNKVLLKNFKKPKFVPLMVSSNNLEKTTEIR